MFCGECGISLTSADKFCSNCGTKTSKNQQSASNDVSIEAISSSVRNQPKELSKQAKLISIVIVILIGVIFMAYLQAKRDAENKAIVDEVDREYQLKNISEGRDALDPGTRSDQSEQIQKDSLQQQPIIAQKDLALDYAKNLASQLERSGHPGCQMLAVTIRSIGYGSNPIEIKMRQIDAVVDKAPGVCFY